MIYLNHAATSYPKPACVVEAVKKNLLSLPQTQFRSTQQQSSDVMQECRKRLGELFRIRDWKRIYFTSGATESFNQMIAGLEMHEGEILYSQIEHNSVLRPLHNFEHIKNMTVTMVPCTEHGMITPQALQEKITSRTKYFFVNHCSNVTGCIQDVKAFCEICHRHQVKLILDVSQSAGCIPIDAEGWGIDGLVFTGHKALMGIQGTGGYWLNFNVKLKPYKYGGTGRESSKLKYQNNEYEYEVGTQNLPGIAALMAGIRYVQDLRVETIFQKERCQMAQLLELLHSIPEIQVYHADAAHQGPCCSIRIKDMKVSDAAYILEQGYGIITRSGLHCAPLIHQAMGTQKEGTIRISISYDTSLEEVKALIDALKEMVQAQKEAYLEDHWL